MTQTHVSMLTSEVDFAEPALGAPDIAAVHAEYADFVWRSLQRVGVRDPDLEDALQDVFVVVHRRLGEFEGRSKLSTWLFGIVVRVAHGYRRRNARNDALSRAETFPRPVAPPTPEDEVRTAEARERLERALAALSPEQRSVLLMHEIEGIRCSAIAEMLGIPLGTVHSRLHVARAAFVRAARRIAKRAGEEP